MNKIRRMQSRDVDAVVQVHMDAFQGFFLTFLGSAFLKELYTGICKDQSGIALVYDDQAVLGFVVGTAQPSGFYKRLIWKRWWKFGIASIRAVTARPLIVPRLLRAFRLPAELAHIGGNTATLMSLAVSRDQHGKGIGKQLVLAFLKGCERRQIEVVNLTTDANDNVAANLFYKSLGFTCARTFSTPEGRLMNEYVIRRQGCLAVRVNLKDEPAPNLVQA